MSEVVGGFRVVLFCPAHLSVVQGSPEDRRDFLNVAISQLRPVYVRALKRFNRALRERNALLRQALENLPEREQTIVRKRFGLGGRPEKTQKEVADLLGISQSYISRLEKKIMKRLKKEIVSFE